MHVVVGKDQEEDELRKSTHRGCHSRFDGHGDESSEPGLCLFERSPRSRT